MSKGKTLTKGISVLLAAVLVFSCLVYIDCLPDADVEAASEPAVTATAKVKPSSVKMKRKASSLSLKVAKLTKNTTVTVLREVYKHKKKTAAKYRWYYVKCGSKKGYIRADKLMGFSYVPVKATMKTSQKSRAGAGKKMKKRGKVPKNATVLVYMRASAKGSKAKWYRIRYNGKTSYVTRSALNFIVEQPKTETGTTVEVPQFTLKSVNGPTVWNVNTPYSVKGTITCSVPITKVKFGVKDSQGSWVFKKTIKDVNSTTFKIKNVNSYMKFGELPEGSYVYRGYAYVGDTCYKLINKPFTIRQLQIPEVLTSTAISLAWELGTKEKYYKYKNEAGAPTAAFKEALKLVYPDRSSWGKAPKKGASCDVFIGTVCRFSGYDPEMPRGLGNMKSGQWEHLYSSPLWERVPYSYKESELQSGDIIIYKRYSGSQHICMYVVIGGKGYLAEAALKTYYGHLSEVTSGSKIFKKSDKKKIRVYRATS